MSRSRTALFVLALMAADVACSNPNPSIDPANPGPTVTLPAPGAEGGPKVSGEVVVYASTELDAVVTRLTNAFAIQNPDAEVSFTAEPPRESMLRFIAGDDAEIFITDLRNIRLLRTYMRNLPGTRSFAREIQILVVPKGNPAKVRRLEDVGELTPDAVCTPPYMLAGSELPLEDVTLPINEGSSPDCGATLVEQVGAGNPAAALVPGSAAGFLRGGLVDRIRVPLTTSLYVTYGMVIITDNEQAKGFANYVASKRGQDLLTESGYNQ